MRREAKLFLGCFLLPVLGAAAVCGGGIGLSMLLVRWSEPHQVAEAFLRESAPVRDAIGEVSAVTTARDSTIEWTPARGRASLKLNVVGDRGHGEAALTLERDAEMPWHVVAATFQAAEGAPVVLREAPARASPAASPERERTPAAPAQPSTPVSPVEDAPPPLPPLPEEGSDDGAPPPLPPLPEEGSGGR